MIPQKDRIESAIRHIQTSVDIDPWAMELAVEALKAQDATDTNVGSNNDTIYRYAAIDALMEILDRPNHAEFLYTDEICRALGSLPSAQPEQKIGKFVRWMEKRETPDYTSYTPHCKCSLCGNELLIESINYCYMCGARLIEDREAERREE